MSVLPLWRPLLLAAGLVGSMAVQAGTWSATKTLEGGIAASSPPEPPRVAMNRQGHALLAWNATGSVRFAERVAGAAWTASKSVPGGANGAGPVAAAIGDNEVAAVAYTTVATRYTPSMLMVSLRRPGAAFGAAVEPVPGVRAGDVRVALSCDGGVTLVWQDASGIWASQLDGVSGPGVCDGQPGTGPWRAPVLLSNGHVGATLPDLAVNPAGAAVVGWQEGAAGQPSAIGAAVRPAGGAWRPAETVSAPTALATWNPKVGVDDAGNAALGYLDGNSFVVATRPAGGVWTAPVPVSGSQRVYYPAFAMSAAGDLLAAWLTVDPANGSSAIWQRMAPAGLGWATASRLSAAADVADWPCAAFAADGTLAVVSWVDDAANVARASVWSAGRWTRQALGAGWWGGQVPVAAGGGAAVAGWAQPAAGNPNSARLVARTWQ